MAVCPNCGTESPDAFRFCPACASPLAQEATPQAEERKVVSILFVDLVGFTASSHDADPEDVRAALGPYHQLLKREIERFGGTVEKFIGDAETRVSRPHRRATGTAAARLGSAWRRSLAGNETRRAR